MNHVNLEGIMRFVTKKAGVEFLLNYVIMSMIAGYELSKGHHIWCLGHVLATDHTRFKCCNW